MPNEIKSATVEPNPTRSRASALAVVTYEKDDADTLYIEPSPGFAINRPSVQLTNLERQVFDIVFERSPQTSQSTCTVHWRLGNAEYTTLVEVLPAGPRLEVTANSRSLREGAPVTLNLRHAPGAGGRLKVRTPASFEATFQPNQVEQPTESSHLVESQAVLVIRRRPRTKGRYATVDFELDGESRSLKFDLEKP